MFNKENEPFPQEERLLLNDFSNLPAVYEFKGRKRRSNVNFLNGRRGLLVLGGPGFGKSFYVIENAIRQLIEKQFALFVFDFKYPELTLLTYNHLLKHQNRYPPNSKFYSVNFSLVILNFHIVVIQE